MKYAYLNDENALAYAYELDVSRRLIQVMLLDQNDSPIRTIDGYVTGGNISINGNSIIRRTGSLSLVTDPFADDEVMLHEVSNINNLISLNKRVSIEIGIENIGVEYPEIDVFWFPMGIYTITNPSVTHDASGIKISLKLNDKMSLLNGTEGGTIPIETTISPYEDRTGEADADGKYPMKSLPIIETIQDLITEFSEVPASQLIVENIPRKIRNKMYWTGAKAEDTDTRYNTLYVYRDDANEWQASLTAPESAQEQYIFTEGQAVGYCETDFVYPGTLATTRNDNVAAVLTKVKNTLGNFEFFFDTEGLFHFREMRNFLNQGSAEDDIISAIDDKYILELNSDENKTVYDFTDGRYIVSYSNNPNYTKVKNDFTIWATGGEDKLPRRYHVLLMAPEPNHRYSFDTYTDPNNELIVRAKKVEMDTDRSFYYPIDSRTNLYFYLLAQQENEEENNIKGGIGHSKLAKEIIEFWPTIYNIQAQTFYSQDYSSFDYYLDIIDVSKIRYNRAVAELAIEEIGNRPLVLEDKESNCLFATDTALDLNIIVPSGAIQEAAWQVTAENGETVLRWNTGISLADKPGRFEWEYTEYGQYGPEDYHYEDEVDTISLPQRTNKLSSNFKGDGIYFLFKNDNGNLVIDILPGDGENAPTDETSPLSVTLQQKAKIKMHVTYHRPLGAMHQLQVAPDIWDHLALGSYQKPAAEYMRSILHEYLGYNNTISISGVPLYHLDVNSRISVEDDASDIHGDYIIQTIGIPLDPSGKMTINAVKAIERI